MKKHKVQKIIAMSGLCSRRKAEEYILKKMVIINDRIAEIGDVASFDDIIKVNHRIIQIKKDFKRKVYILNKRLGEVCTRKDPQGRKSVFERLPKLESGRWVMVGRLDINTSGLLIFTNDGEYAHELMHPSFNLQRIYLVEVTGEISPTSVSRLLRGVKLYDGISKFSEVKVLKKMGNKTQLQVIITSGKNRIVRRLFKSQGLQVVSLHRIQHGHFKLSKSESG